MQLIAICAEIVQRAAVNRLFVEQNIALENEKGVFELRFQRENNRFILAQRDFRSNDGGKCSG